MDNIGYIEPAISFELINFKWYKLSSILCLREWITRDGGRHRQWETIENKFQKEKKTETAAEKGIVVDVSCTHFKKRTVAKQVSVSIILKTLKQNKKTKMLS